MRIRRATVVAPRTRLARQGAGWRLPYCRLRGAICSAVAALLLEEAVFLQALKGHAAIGFLLTAIVDKQQTLQITGQHVNFEVDF